MTLLCGLYLASGLDGAIFKGVDVLDGWKAVEDAKARLTKLQSTRGCADKFIRAFKWKKVQRRASARGLAGTWSMGLFFSR